MMSGRYTINESLIGEWHIDVEYPEGTNKMEYYVM